MDPKAPGVLEFLGYGREGRGGDADHKGLSSRWRYIGPGEIDKRSGEFPRGKRARRVQSVPRWRWTCVGDAQRHNPRV